MGEFQEICEGEGCGLDLIERARFVLLEEECCGAKGCGEENGMSI